MTSRILSFLILLTLAGACTCGADRRQENTWLPGRRSDTVRQDSKGNAVQHGGSPLLFDSREHDFGIIPEAGGKVSHTFTFTNAGASPVSVNSAIPSCRCVTLSFARKAMKPGERGEITVTFDPEGITDTFSKSIRVISSSGQDILWIRGKISMDRDIGEEYPYQMGAGLMADRRTLSFGQIQHGSGAIQREMHLFNPSGKEVRLSCRIAGRSGCVSVSMPESAAPGASATITVTAAPQPWFYGTLTDRIIICADGVQCPEMQLSGTVIDDLRKVNVETAPRMRCIPAYFHLSGFLSQDAERRSAVIANDGADELIIRKVECPDGITSSLAVPATLMPSEKLGVTFNVHPEALEAVPDAKVKFVTNDAQQPVHTVIFEKS